jgi:hypothetical protein
MNNNWMDGQEEGGTEEMERGIRSSLQIVSDDFDKSGVPYDFQSWAVAFTFIDKCTFNPCAAADGAAPLPRRDCLHVIHMDHLTYWR